MIDLDICRKRNQQFYNWLRFSLFGLILLRVSGLWLLTPPATVIGLTTVLIAFVWPVLRRDIKASLWLSFVSCLFFTIGVLNAMTDGRELFGIIESVLAATIFISAMMFAHYSYKELEVKQEVLAQSST